MGQNENWEYIQIYTCLPLVVRSKYVALKKEKKKMTVGELRNAFVFSCELWCYLFWHTLEGWNYDACI